MRDPRSILITGAAQGIGAALARVYSSESTSVFLGDINAKRLEEVRTECEDIGAAAYSRVVSVTDAAAMGNWIAEAEAIRPLDLVIANAGISHGNEVHEETAEQIRSVFAVNLDGMLNTVLPVLPLFRARQRGQIALMSSLAGTIGLPHAPSYCATKGALRLFAQGLQARVKREGVTVSVMIPAFVKTPMTAANLYNMPGILEVDQAAAIMKKKLARGKSEFVFPWFYALMAGIVRAMPSSIVARFTALK